jgi:hypothetical protein
MRRRIMDLLTAASTLMCVAVVALWVRSYVKADFAGYKSGTGARRLTGIISTNGAIWIAWRHFTEDGTPEFYLRSDSAARWSVTDSPWLPFYFAHNDPRATDARSAVIPHWSGLILAIPGGLFLWRKYPRHSTPGICRACGYDMRATPDRCPECGSPRPSRSAAA